MNTLTGVGDKWPSANERLGHKREQSIGNTSPKEGLCG